MPPLRAFLPLVFHSMDVLAALLHMARRCFTPMHSKARAEVEGTTVGAAGAAGWGRSLGSGKAEITDAQVAVGIEQQVAGLQVLVHYTPRVQVLHPPQHLHHTRSSGGM